ncbi:heterokaryon incompatibility protein-domain-containing protein [Lophiotrema nucula]|uniref:Heterokaryon incompatibility protein-domain-containing protein n=1 Tax=Lophiotrema nucula TaxID=690887 RepID=A0A6A5YPL3_9PLEO|nr:heterokaryon incompatibility protein-domain-containing protein [Lophiotrema nucula]
MPERNLDSVYTGLQLDQTKRELRLLHFTFPEKDSGIQAIADTEPLHVILEKVSLDDKATPDKAASEFIALSYVWGDADDQREIYVNGHAIWITRNLDSALRAYARIYLNMASRDPEKTEDILPLWADGICIDQGSKDERGHQVSLMLSIYAAASFVFVWLGEGNVTTRLAIKLLKELAHPSDHFDAKRVQWQALFQFLQNPWFTRLWVVQEFAAARPLSILMWCGYDWILPSFLCRTVKRLLHVVHIDPLSELTRAVYTTNVIDNLLAIDQIFFVRGLHHSRRWAVPSIIKLCILISTSQRSSCTVPHDVIYALLGLAEKSKSIPELYPNYRLSIGTLFAEFFKTAVESTGALTLLSYVKHDLQTTMPSWVPNWNDKRSDIPARLVSFKTELSGDHDSVCTDLFSASHATVANCRFTPKLTICLCDGILVESVSRLYGDRLVGVEFTSEEICSWIERIGAALTHIWRALHPYKQEGFLEALWRTMLADQVTLDRKTHCPAPKSCRHIFDIIWNRSNNGHEENDRLLSNEYFLPVLQAVASSCRFRTLYGTASGRVGLGPPYTQQGDMVCVLFGGSVPYLLHDRKNGSHSFVGETYVHGIMRGEGLYDVNGKHKATQCFILT